jgi:ABC-type multidrug transport system fused ATPase/permease subunit
MRYRIIPYTLSLVFQSVYLCTIDPILGLLTLVITLSIIGTTFLSIPKCEIPNSMVEQIDSNIFESIDEVLLNFGTIVDNATCKDEMQILQDLGKSAVELRGKAVNCSLSQSGLMFGQTAVYAVFFIWRLMHIRDKQNVEASVAALTVLLQVLDTSKTMIYYIDSISKVSANLTVNRDLIIAFVTKQLSEVSSESALDERAPPSSSAAIELRNVTFAYVNQKPIFENLNLSFEKNKCTIVHGPNGTGKSTILKLLTRYLTPTKGQLYIHGDSYSSQSPDRIRGQIAHCTQNPILFNRSVADNMLYGVEGVDRSELESRLTDMGLADFVGNLRQGLDTIVGKRGTNISGGQRQVVQLVRCLLQNKPILLLDEATSAVDSANRQLILQLINLAADKTVIFVTHDPEIIASYPSTSVVNLAAASEN